MGRLVGIETSEARPRVWVSWGLKCGARVYFALCREVCIFDDIMMRF